LRASQTLTGFNDQVSFQKVAQITRSDDVAARVEVYDGDKRVTSGQSLLLRGSVLDVYTGDDPDNRWGQWQWRRSAPLGEGELAYAGQPLPLVRIPRTSRHLYKQVFTLQPTGTTKLFAIAGAVGITCERTVNIRFSDRDGVLETVEPMATQFQYTAVSTGELSAAPESDSDQDRPSQINPDIRKYAQRPDVCGVDANGAPLAQHPLAGDHTFDAQIAANIERHLRTQFKYTLDLTNEGLWGQKDPIVAFLYDFKRGHCEFFAGAMTLLCQSLDIPARLIVGFRCGADDFNSLGDYYAVKQSNAHAWCEVFTGQQWDTFDPTSGIEVQGQVRRGYFNGLKKVFDYLEFKWANSVVAYDRNQRRNLVDTLDYQLSKAPLPTGTQSLSVWQQKIQSQWAKWESIRMGVISTILGAVISSMALAVVVAIVWYLIERWRMRRRARRIGLGPLSTPDQLRMVRQLGFYDDMLRVLEKHHIPRPRHLTALEFSRTLSFLPSGAFDDVYRLTKLFYRIRYGAIALNPHRQRQLIDTVHHLAHIMDSGDRAEYPS
jgi:transglutaminase-like putative cysteine protease